MDKLHNSGLVPYARKLRKNMTKEERHLWYDFLRDYEPKFLRQKILGKYIADFYCPKAKLIVELDGGQHYEEKEILRDSERTAYFERYHIRVLRIPNNEVTQNFSGVCEKIELAVKK